ncbi:MAG: DUF933 domain-containing protein [Verrucomicrobia bacterium]|nr:DUF933 domain-containing protein [Verrucomicrobiota bacterium]
MKICAYNLTDIQNGNHNVRDTRLDQIHELVEAKKKAYATIEVTDADDLNEADAIITKKEYISDLILEDLEFIETRLARSPEDDEKQLLVKLQDALEQERFISTLELTPAEKKLLGSRKWITLKPVVSEPSIDAENWPALVSDAVKFSDYISFATVGGKENRAWLIPNGTTAKDAASEIHTDLQKGFIRAEVISFEDLIQYGGETGAKRAGKMRLETKDYTVLDYDILSFRCKK